MAQNIQLAELNQELMRQQGRAKRRADLRRQMDDVMRQQVAGRRRVTQGGGG